MYHTSDAFYFIPQPLRTERYVSRFSASSLLFVLVLNGVEEGVVFVWPGLVLSSVSSCPIFFFFYGFMGRCPPRPRSPRPSTSERTTCASCGGTGPLGLPSLVEPSRTPPVHTNTRASKQASKQRKNYTSSALSYSRLFDKTEPHRTPPSKLQNIGSEELVHALTSARTQETFCKGRDKMRVATSRRQKQGPRDANKAKRQSS